MKADFKVVQTGNLRGIRQSIVVDNFHSTNKVALFCAYDYTILVDINSIGRWRVKEGSIKINQ